MSYFRRNENYERHLINMDVTALQNAKARAVDNEDWDELNRLQKEEKELENMLNNSFKRRR